jgi:hypothetical protein
MGDKFGVGCQLEAADLGLGFSPREYFSGLVWASSSLWGWILEKFLFCMFLLGNSFYNLSIEVMLIK